MSKDGRVPLAVCMGCATRLAGRWEPRSTHPSEHTTCRIYGSSMGLFLPHLDEVRSENNEAQYSAATVFCTRFQYLHRGM